MVAAALCRGVRCGPSDGGPGRRVSTALAARASRPCLWGSGLLVGAGPGPSTSSPLDDDDKPEEVDVDFGDEEAAPEVFTGASRTAKAD